MILSVKKTKTVYKMSTVVVFKELGFYAGPLCRHKFCVSALVKQYLGTYSVSLFVFFKVW